MAPLPQGPRQLAQQPWWCGAAGAWPEPCEADGIAIPDIAAAEATAGPPEALVAAGAAIPGIAAHAASRPPRYGANTANPASRIAWQRPTHVLSTVTREG